MLHAQKDGYTHKLDDIRCPLMGSILKAAFLGNLNSKPIDNSTALVTEKTISIVGTRPSVAPGAGAGRGGSGN